MTDYRKYQEQLIGIAKSKYQDKESLSEQVISAFYKVPRHCFVERYRNQGSTDWLKVTEENLDQHLGTLYTDYPLILKGSDEDFKSKTGSTLVSTISQPSFVLRLIDLLDLHEGHRVFELGTASGWNAALMAQLIGPNGRIATVEIISDLAVSAEKRMKQLNIQNVTVISGDGADGFSELAPFDRAMFTAGSYDLPLTFHKQIKEGGLLLFVLKNKGGIDNLLLLEKKRDCFESIQAFSCGFVPLTGKGHLPEMEEKDLEWFLTSQRIDLKPISQRNYWWGSADKKHFFAQSGSLKSYLSLFDSFESIQTGNADRSFGWFDFESKSFALAQPNQLLGYGNDRAGSVLMEKIHEWVDLGMPTLLNLKLKIYPSDDAPAIEKGSWKSKRKGSTFIWSLPS